MYGRRIVLSMAGAAVAVTGGVAGTVPVSASAHVTLTTGLNGAEAVPAGDPDGSGTATLEITGAVVCYRVEMSDVDIVPPTAVHVHEGTAGTNGNALIALIDLLSSTGPNGEQIVQGCTASPFAPDVVANPSGFYIQAHNGEFPSGALRGQLGDAT